MSESTKSSSFALAVSWLIVLVPLSWGVYMSGKNAVKLFTMGSPAVTSSSSTK